MEIILLILKILGFVLLGLLGLALLLLLTVLFVPVRYKAKGSKHEELRAEGRVTWLLHALRIRAVYEDGKLKTKGKLLFFKIMDSDEDVEEELADEDDSLFPDEIDDADDCLSPGEGNTAESGVVTASEPEEGKTTEPEEKEKTGPGEETAAGQAEKNTSEPGERLTAEAVEDKTIDFGEETAAGQGEKNTSVPEGVNTSDQPEKTAAEPGEERLSGHKVGKKKKRKKDDTDEGKEEPKKQGIVKKAKNLYNIKNDPRAREFYRVAKKRVIKIVRHILPRKLKGSIRFGTGDPCSTGKILGAAAMMYPIYGGHISVEPVFEEKALEFDLYLRGRIRVITVLLPALRTYWSRDFKYLRKKIKKAVK